MSDVTLRPSVDPARRRLRWWLAAAVVALVSVPIVAARGSAAPVAPRGTFATCSGATYTVVSGDGWYLIASKLNVSVTSLLTANKATLTTALHPGDILCVPGSTTTTTAAPSTTVAPTTTVPTSTTGTPTSIRQFPVQGGCWFADTFGAPRAGNTRNDGVDILAPVGKFVYAVDDGTLTARIAEGSGSPGGNTWRLTRADGAVFVYSHLSAFAAGLTVGSTVRAGQIIGQVGTSGNAGAPHLHFEARTSAGTAVNPTPLVRVVDGCATSTVPTQPATGGTTSTTLAPTTTVAPTTPTATTTPTTVPTLNVSPPPSAGRWRFIAAVKAFDTAGGRVAAGSTTRIRVNTLSGVVSTTPGVLVRITGRGLTTPGFLSFASCATGAVTTSSLAMHPGRLNATMSTAVVVNGEICVFASTAVDLRIDVVGFLADDGIGAAAVGPRRALDTRVSGRLAANVTRTLLPSTLGVALGSRAVTTTITVLDPASAGRLSVGPCGGTPWTVDYAALPQQVVSMVARMNDGGLCVTTSTSAHVIVDVTGVWSGTTSALRAVQSVRMFDSRSTMAVGTGVTRVATGLVSTISRAQFTVTVVGGSVSGSVYVWNCAAAKPLASVVATTASTNTAATVTLDVRGGAICVSATSTMHVVIDVVAVG
ncbi:MAG: peptidoglycan DD-metalloendopeptidase family protein [Ilumatobacteraceae bacterium]